MKTSRLKLWLLLMVELCCFFATSNGETSKKQLKDIQLKIPMTIRARRNCADADCVKTCPMDYELDSEKQFCRYTRSTCPPNYVRRHGSCILMEVQCPHGSIRQGNRCVVKSLQCPPGYVLEGNNCVNSKYCPDGYHWENGFCYHEQRAQVCPSGYENRQGVCIQICVNCDAACAECSEEAVPLKCPASYELYRGRCLKILQSRADVVLRNVTYRVPVECDDEDIYSNGLCLQRKFDSPQCEIGSFYGGRCVEVAKCSRGAFANDCECVVQSSQPAVCRQGKPSSCGCSVSGVQCRKPSQLVNLVCTEQKDSHRAFCPSGSPMNGMFCSASYPSCPSGFMLDGSFCRRNMSYPIDCGRYKLHNGWCSSIASCEPGYRLQENGDCIRESRTQQNPCPASTTFDGEHCVHVEPLCDPDHEYDERYGVCVKCIDQPAVCDEASGYHLSNGTCERLESLCPNGFKWENNHCLSESSSYVTCESGQFHEHHCIHSYLSCPNNLELVGDVCIKQEQPSCPEGSMYQNGICVATRHCPTGFTPGLNTCVEEKLTPLDNSIKPDCPYGFQYESSNCVRILRLNATIETRYPQCSVGYSLQQGKCVKEYQGLLVCPPKTIHMNQDNKCFCKVDLVCPSGYERMGDECMFRSANYYSPLLNFLGPCYGIQCGLQFCLSLCHSPPCPVQPCSERSLQYGLPYVDYKNQIDSDVCGIGETCSPSEQRESIVGLTCPPGYSRANNTCIAYYDRVCQGGYKMRSGRCVKSEESNVMCPLGFVRSNDTCLRLQCNGGYTLEGTICKKLEYRSPSPCPKNYAYVDGICLHKSDCVGGSVEGNNCVRRRYEPYSCPPKFTQLNDSCVQLASCSSQDLIFVDNTCHGKGQEQLRCPANTVRVKNLCVHTDIPKFEKIRVQPTSCNGQITPQGLCAYKETPSCNKGYVLRHGRCVTCSSKTPQCPADMVIIGRKCLQYRKPCNNGWYLNEDEQCVAVSVRSATCSQGTLSFNRCLHGIASCKTGYIVDGNKCVYREVILATCSRGILKDGVCIDLLQCNGPDYTISNGWCLRNTYSDPICNSKSTRTRDLCISGFPKCPDNFYHLNGQCFSSQVQPAECRSTSKCLENFCSIGYPSCSASFNFDGSVCTKIISRTPRCPSGTTPVNGDHNYCQYSTEHADFLCPEGYNFKNGICQKRQYVEAVCQNGFRRKADSCIRKACGNPSLTSYCGTLTLSPSTHGISTSSHHFPVRPLAPLPTTPAVVHTQNEVCCRVFSPRMCSSDDHDDWNCSHTENRRCGPFCQYADQRIFLRTEQSTYVEGVLMLVPPVGRESHDDGSGDEDYDDNNKPIADCDGCTDLSYDCSSYCYTFECQKNNEGCLFQEQREFCSAYPGPGCKRRDGCYDKDFCVSLS